jgi:hypothetical protein
MLFGPTPFECEDRKKIQSFIENLEVFFPEYHEISELAKSFIRMEMSHPGDLLEKDPVKRLSKFPDGIGNHPWLQQPSPFVNIAQELEISEKTPHMTYFYPDHTQLDPIVDYVVFKPKPQ